MTVEVPKYMSVIPDYLREELEETFFGRPILGSRHTLILDDLPEPDERENDLNPSVNAWDVAEAVLSVSRRVLLRGKPGSGKTYTSVNSGLKDGQKVYQITMTPETPMAELRGHYITKGGEFVWADGPAVRAWREGARLVINEIDRAGEDVLSFMYAILDDPEFAETTLPTGEVVRPAEGFQVVATMNGEPDDLPDALQDRLPVDIEIKELHPEAIKRLPEDLQTAALNTALAPNPERAISIRMWMEYASLRESIGEEMAAHAVFGPKAHAALTALKIAETASPAIDMEGTELDENTLGMIHSYLVWAANTDPKPSNAEIARNFEMGFATKGFATPSQLHLDDGNPPFIQDDTGRRWTLQDFE